MHDDRIVSHIVFFLVPGVHLLDLAGPAQVFSTAADFGHPYTLAYIAEQPQVSTAQGLPLVAGLDWPELGPEELIVVPGWRTGTLAGGPAIGAASLQVLRDHHARGGTVASVCAGAEALAALLDGRHCTTHHDVQDELALRHPRAVVVRDVLFTADDRVITSAGIASGIDLALHLVATRHGPAVAAQVARAMVVYARRNGHEPQSSAMRRHRSHLDDTVHRAESTLVRPTTPPAHPAAARVQRTHAQPPLPAAPPGSPRCATSSSPLPPQRAQHFISHGATIDAAARSVGFEDPRMLRRLRARTA